MKMNIKEIQLGLSRLSCSRYSDFDELIIEKASSLGLPLIGGTALEVLGSYFNVSGFRKRSDNDLDFISNDTSLVKGFSAWLKSEVDPSKVQVDVMLIKSHNIDQKYIMNLGGVLVVTPEYIVWSKLLRFLDRDRTDIAWLLPLCNFDVLEELVEDLGVTDKQLSDLNSLIDEVSHQLADSKTNKNKGCLMLRVVVPFLDELASLIDADDLHEYGVEDDPHITVFYGANSDTFPSLDSISLSETPQDVQAHIVGLSFFKNDSFDVLKFDIHAPVLEEIHRSMVSRLEVKTTFSEYVPHSTVAYLKSGMSRKYLDIISEFTKTKELPIRLTPLSWNYTTGR